jgi:hypothetical protein
MRHRKLLALVLVAGLLLFFGAAQTALADERIVKLKIPGCG